MESQVRVQVTFIIVTLHSVASNKLLLSKFGQVLTEHVACYDYAVHVSMFSNDRTNISACMCSLLAELLDYLQLFRPPIAHCN
jgi:hypothetical protein